MADQQMTEVEREAFKKAFDAYDKDSNGHVTNEELSQVLKKLGQNPTDKEIADFITACDTDKNGTIEYGEFCKYMVKHRREVFKEIDTDGNGFITIDEFRNGYKKFGVDLTPEKAEAVFKAADADGDGRMSYDEFVKTLQDQPLC